MGRIGKWIVAIALMLIVGSFMVPVGYLLVLVGRGRAVDREIARIKAAGEPVSAADLAGRPIPDSENAALVYEKCFKLLPRSPRSSDNGVLRDFLRPERRAQAPKLWGTAKAMLNRYQGVLAMAERAAAMPKCKFPAGPGRSAGYGSFRVRNLRQLVRFATAQALVESRDGASDAAVRHLELAYRIAASVKDDYANQPMMYGCIGSASDALMGCAELASISESQARSVSAVIDGLDIRDSVRLILLGDRARGIEFYSGVEHGDLTVVGAESYGSGKMFRRFSTSLPGRLLLYSDELFYLNEMKRRLDAPHTPYRLRKVRRADPGTDALGYALFSSVPVTNVDAWSWMADRGNADIAGSQVFLGLLAYRDHFGSYPASLDELKTKLNWRLPEDPFSGKPFVYRRQGKGFEFHSVGNAVKDNHGFGTARIGFGGIVWKLDR